MHAALDLMPCSLASTLTLTPGRTRNLDQDMQALRLSRQDNPFLQLIASRESLLDADDCNDAAILMSNVTSFPIYIPIMIQKMSKPIRST
jgi:hypothetical protein